MSSYFHCSGDKSILVATMAKRAKMEIVSEDNEVEEMEQFGMSLSRTRANLQKMRLVTLQLNQELKANMIDLHKMEKYSNDIVRNLTSLMDGLDVDDVRVVSPTATEVIYTDLELDAALRRNLQSYLKNLGIAHKVRLQALDTTLFKQDVRDTKEIIINKIRFIYEHITMAE
jgi:hypothetical protein